MNDTSPDQRPLTGVRVIDAATFIAAPFCATLLGEFGAEVIKVEMPKTGDPLRRLGSITPETGDSLIWLSDGRNKKSITINLRHERGRDLVRKLAAQTDVLIENFKPGAMEKWGLGPEDLKALNPGLVYARISGYGQTGPYAARPGFASVCEGIGGFRYLNHGGVTRFPVITAFALAAAAAAGAVPGRSLRAAVVVLLLAVALVTGGAVR